MYLVVITSILELYNLKGIAFAMAIEFFLLGELHFILGALDYG
jgi:hypothetical protein